MEQVNTGVSLKSIRIDNLQKMIAQLEAEKSAPPSPALMLDTVKLKLNLKNDASLARALETAPPTISKTRTGRIAIGCGLLIRLHEISGLPIKDLKALAGI